MIVFQKHGSTQNITIAIAMKLEQNYYYFWSVSESVIFQVERLAEFHCTCQSYLLPSNSSSLSFTYLFCESRTQKCPCREPACSLSITTWSLSVSVSTVLPSDGEGVVPLLLRLQSHLQRQARGPKGSTADNWGWISQVPPKESWHCIILPLFCCLKTCLILSHGWKCAFQCRRLAWVELWERMLWSCQHNLSVKFSLLRNVKVALKFSFCWGGFFAVCISDCWVGVLLFSDWDLELCFSFFTCT